MVFIDQSGQPSVENDSRGFLFLSRKAKPREANEATPMDDKNSLRVDWFMGKHVLKY